jgi:hypothetical protein
MIFIGGNKMAKHEEVKNGVIFPAGEKNPFSQFFVGQSYLKGLVYRAFLIPILSIEVFG